MIFLFTDYGLDGPYIGQVETVLHRRIPGMKCVNLMADAPRNNPRAGAYLLASLIGHIPESSILFCVVDPGVGTDRDDAVILNINNRWFVGPDNGLFDIVARADKALQSWRINLRPENVSNSFHGRDIYAPVCAMIANKEPLPGDQFNRRDLRGFPDDLYEVIYSDHFGNCMTGIRAEYFDKTAVFKLADQEIAYSDTFARVPAGAVFWYANSNGLVEIAVNQGSAKQTLGLTIGSKVS